MSLVGTRPILPGELEQYELHHRTRIAIKPGITGMWQVSGRSDITDFEEVVRLDRKYIENWNMGDFSFVMKNTFNEDAYFSTNHGTGRMQDKHIAKEQYTEKETTKEMGERKVSLFRVGNGSLAEQNMHAFKDPESIISETIL